MFEDLESFMQNEHSKHNSKGGNKRFPADLENELMEFLKNKLGGHGADVKIEKIDGKGVVVTHVKKGSSDGLKTAVDGFAKSIEVLGTALKVKPLCMDAKQKTLKVGDVLNCPGGETKVVLKVGYGFCNLSRTDDHSEDDGVWFQEQIINFGFKL